MNFYSVYVPYGKNYVERNISEEDAYGLQAAILNQEKAVTWVIHDCKKEREISQKILDR